MGYLKLVNIDNSFTIFFFVSFQVNVLIFTKTAILSQVLVIVEQNGQRNSVVERASMVPVVKNGSNTIC